MTPQEEEAYNIAGIPGFRPALWLFLAFVAGYAMFPLAALSFYLPIPFIQLPWIMFLYATPLTFPAFATVMALRARARNMPDVRPDLATIVALAVFEFVLIVVGAVTFFCTLGEEPWMKDMMDIGGHIA